MLSRLVTALVQVYPLYLMSDKARNVGSDKECRLRSSRFKDSENGCADPSPVAQTRRAYCSLRRVQRRSLSGQFSALRNRRTAYMRFNIILRFTLRCCAHSGAKLPACLMATEASRISRIGESRSQQVDSSTLKTVGSPSAQAYERERRVTPEQMERALSQECAHSGATEGQVHHAANIAGVSYAARR